MSYYFNTHIVSLIKSGNLDALMAYMDHVYPLLAKDEQESCIRGIREHGLTPDQKITEYCERYMSSNSNKYAKHFFLNNLSRLGDFSNSVVNEQIHRLKSSTYQCVMEILKSQDGDNGQKSEAVVKILDHYLLSENIHYLEKSAGYGSGDLGRLALTNKALNRLTRILDIKYEHSLYEFFHRMNIRNGKKVSIFDLPAYMDGRIVSPELLIALRARSISGHYPILVSNRLIDQAKETFPSATILTEPSDFHNYLSTCFSNLADIALRYGLSVPGGHSILLVDIDKALELEISAPSQPKLERLMAFADEYWYARNATPRRLHTPLQILEEILKDQEALESFKKSPHNNPNTLQWMLLDCVKEDMPSPQKTTSYSLYSKRCSLIASLKSELGFTAKSITLFPVNDDDVDVLYKSGIKFGDALNIYTYSKYGESLSLDSLKKLVEMNAAIPGIHYETPVEKALQKAHRNPSRINIAALRAYPFEDLVDVAKKPEHFDAIAKCYKERRSEIVGEMSVTGKKNCISSELNL